jgi:RNA 3'-terminal phosphate cyclase (ATP)
MGAQVTLSLERPGFYPAGGGKFSVSIKPGGALRRLDLLERGEVTGRRARAIVANLPLNIAERELAVIGRKLSWRDDWMTAEKVDNSRGPGNIVMIEIESERVSELFTGFGERGVRAEAVAERAAKDAREYLAARAAVGEYLADQLLVPLALARGGSFTALRLSRHATTNIEVIRRFIDVNIETTLIADRTWRVEVSE